MQARMAAEQARLASTRVKADDPAVQEVAAASGQRITGANGVLLEELLRRPRVTHRCGDSKLRLLSECRLIKSSEQEALYFPLVMEKADLLK